MKTKSKAEINKVIKANFGKMSYREIGKLVGLDSEAVRGRARRMGLTGSTKKEKPVGERVEYDIEETKSSKKLKDTSKKYKYLIKRNDELEKLISVLNAPKEHNLQKIVSIKNNSSSEATAFALLSDWHIEQEVDPNKIAYPNKYNLEVARQRAEECFVGIVKLCKNAQQHYDVDHLVLALMGDFITGNIHLSELPILKLGVAEACFFVEELLIRGIQYILDNTNVRITCPCVVGNHSRITEKVWLSSEEDNSVETIIYYHIKKHFENNRRFELIMPSGPERFIDVYGLTFVICHGHHGFKYGGGVNGLSVPIRRTILTKYSNRQVYLVCLAHLHTYTQDRKFVVNGSLIGYDTYANSKGLEFDVPKQTFFLVEKRFLSRTVTTPIMFTI